ncbi:F-box domain-containing protein [Heracleum sosnowskyi]|uniref:F-box domain-containing protein n=1 Tax=Heracleum sosnowskyi TaxID=360622 RepID=A0AAD8HB69_9APIA|nr:F-box domain-containing protein [Heracleum sosnowskyi]
MEQSVMEDEDMLLEVLSRLPVKSLIQCKSNCYSTYDVDSSFALFQFASAHDPDHVTKLEFPYGLTNAEGVDRDASIIGSDAGIICVCVDDASYDSSDYDDSTRDSSNEPHNIYLWNPATKRSKLIPPHSLHGDGSKLLTLGFGFDHRDYDLKVVRVVSGSVPPEVYSATRNSWRSIKHSLTDIPINHFHVCLHGFLFTIGNNGMMAFDLNKEVFICNIKLPVISSSDAHLKEDHIIDFKDSVAICIGFIKKVDLWTLDDEACFRGGGEINASWTMMFSIGLSEPLDYVEGFFNRVVFLIAVVGGDELFLYNSEEKVGEMVYNINQFFEIGTSVCKCTESLVSIAGSELINCSDSDNNSNGCLSLSAIQTGYQAREGSNGHPNEDDDYKDLIVLDP